MADLLEQAENCRRQALTYVGRPEASFLMKVARGFEELADERHRQARVVDGQAEMIVIPARLGLC